MQRRKQTQVIYTNYPKSQGHCVSMEGFPFGLEGSKSIFGLEKNLFLDFGAKAKDEGQGGEMWRGEGRGHRADIGSSGDMPSPGRDSFPPAFSLPGGRKLVAETPQKSSLEVTEVIM